MKRISRIYLAGGCFWGVEEYFDRISGIYSSSSGYANGKSEEASYRTLAETDHAETVRLVYDPEIISLRWILEYFFRIIDPESVNRQGNDIGRQYRTGIYYDNPEDLDQIQGFMDAKAKVYDLAVEVEDLKNFVLAEDYHLDYLKKNPGGYCHVNLSEIPEDHLAKLDLARILSDQELHIMKENGTDRPGSHELDRVFDKGIYIDKISRKALFVSTKKFDAGCGWPSFSEPIYKDRLAYVEDRSLSRLRTEVRSISSDSHLGHVFNDGPASMGGLRYCINGSALDFIPLEDFDLYGYERYKEIL